VEGSRTREETMTPPMAGQAEGSEEGSAEGSDEGFFANWSSSSVVGMAYIASEVSFSSYCRPFS
jgi:hypothetical protein